MTYDYDRDTDFSRWTSFAWAPPGVPGGSPTVDRLRRAVEDGFVAKGYARVERPDRADFLVTFRAAAWRETLVSESFRGPGFGRDLGLQRVPTGALVVEVYDRRTRGLAWHGVVTDELAGDPEKADRRTAKAVEKLLKKFPSREAR